MQRRILTTPEREAWRDTQERCWLCRQRREIQVHEITSGPNRKKALAEPCTWMAVCPWCHDELQYLPLPAQLAHKLLNDPENYDRQRVNVIRRRQPDAIDASEVEIQLVRILTEKGRGNVQGERERER
jgi:hypothetical protein